MSYLRILPLAFVVLLPAQAVAEELALQPVIAAALDYGSKVAHADVKISQAEGQAQQASGAFDWRANARAGWARLYYPRVQTVGDTQVLINELQNSWEPEITAGATKLFRDGIQIQPGITFYPSSSVSQAQTFGLTRPVPSLNVQIPLMHGLDDNNTAAANERASLDEVAGAQMERAAAQQQAAMDAAQTYWRCLAASEEESVLLENRQTVLDYVEGLRKLVAAGQITPLALEQTLVGQTERDKQLDSARKEQVDCRSTLAALLKRDSDMAFPTLAAAFPNMDKLTTLMTALRETPLVEAALQNRPDMHALQQYITAARERLIAASNERDPKINLLLDPNGFFVNFTYSLEGNTEQGGEATAAAKVADASLNLSELQDQIRRDVSEGVVALRNSLAALAERRHSEETLSQVVKDARHAVQAGGMDEATLRGLEDQRTDAAVQLVEARLDCALNLAALRLVTGTLDVEGGDAAARDAGLFLSAQF
jgi:outer membrane protein TolC